jgi:hypothetical protein
MIKNNHNNYYLIVSVHLVFNIGLPSCFVVSKIY